MSHPIPGREYGENEHKHEAVGGNRQGHKIPSLKNLKAMTKHSIGKGFHEKYGLPESVKKTAKEGKARAEALKNKLK